MGFFLRRSKTLGPLRINLSKSGLGVSTGRTGARIGIGPRGTYVHLGRGGIYYRHQLSRPTRVPRAQPVAPFRATGVIETADPTELVVSSADETLTRINARLRRTARAPLVWGGAVVLAFAVPAVTGASLLFWVILSAGILYGWVVQRSDRRQRTTRLSYELDDDAQRQFTRVQQICLALQRSERVWRIETEEYTGDWKRHAGANGLVTRHVAQVLKLFPPFIETNVEVWGISARPLQLFFLPDHLLVFQKGVYGAVGYNTLTIETGTADFREEETPPRDADVVGSTWKYVRRDGGPDRRFANNRQLPIARYGTLDIRSKTGLHLVLQLSGKSIAEAVAEAFQGMQAALPVASITVSDQETTNVELRLQGADSTSFGTTVLVGSSSHQHPNNRTEAPEDRGQVLPSNKDSFRPATR